MRNDPEMKKIQGTAGPSIVYREREADICRVEICLSAIERNAHHPPVPGRAARVRKYTRKRSLIGFAQELDSTTLPKAITETVTATL